MIRQIKSQALVIILLIMVIVAFLGAYIANLISLSSATYSTYYQDVQAEFITDMGLERGKELLADTSGDWRPWENCLSQCTPVCSNCHCPVGTCTSCDYTSCQSCYLEEMMTIPPHGKKGYYHLYVIEDTSLRLQAFGEFED